jgi:hypothetical protein
MIFFPIGNNFFYFLIEDFFSFATGVNDTGGQP